MGDTIDFTPGIPAGFTASRICRGASGGLGLVFRCWWHRSNDSSEQFAPDGLHRVCVSRCHTLFLLRLRLLSQVRRSSSNLSKSELWDSVAFSFVLRTLAEDFCLLFDSVSKDLSVKCQRAGHIGVK